jgi:hypothetical protein
VPPPQASQQDGGEGFVENDVIIGGGIQRGVDQQVNGLPGGEADGCPTDGCCGILVEFRPGAVDLDQFGLEQGLAGHWR